MSTTLEVSLSFIDYHIRERDQKNEKQPLVIGISGPQGSGKSYLAKQIYDAITEFDPNMKVVSFSMDDLYLTRECQKEVSMNAKRENNTLLQGRGLPGTHDVQLCKEIFHDLLSVEKDASIKIPVYDKSKYNGEGDRSEEKFWTFVDTKPDIILFEGWFNGYMSFDPDVARLCYLTASNDKYLKRHPMYQIEELNIKLKEYEAIWDYFDLFIFLESDISNVLEWRIEQEHYLIETKGKGMSDKEVGNFVERYMPVYEMYYGRMCEKGLDIKDKHQIRLCIDKKRKLASHSII